MQRRTLRITLIITVLIGLFTAIGGILSNVVSSTIAMPLWVAVPLLIIVVLVGVGLTLWQVFLQINTVYSEPLPSGQHRQQLLAKVRVFWVTGVLEKPLQEIGLIALGLHEQADAVENPWRLILQQLDQPTHPLPSGTHITEIYDNVGGELLILGEPGSGKTTLLLELARDLLNRAQQDNAHPMPVVFNLSSWAAKRKPITEWLVEELHTKYRVPRKLGQWWVDMDQILPLLDGLDEVSPTHLAECAKAINVYRRNHGLVSTVVCSRSADYLAQTTRIFLQNAVIVHPLLSNRESSVKRVHDPDEL